MLQPRVGVSLPSAGRSWFVRLYAGDAGIDPYTRAVSDVYQDLFEEGSFIGKGIYDVDAFERALAGRFPENTILSHDLLESVHARSALVSDVEFYEEYPSRYNVDVGRRHRWIRGDWQIVRLAVAAGAGARLGAGGSQSALAPLAVEDLRQSPAQPGADCARSFSWSAAGYWCRNSTVSAPGWCLGLSRCPALLQTLVESFAQTGSVALADASAHDLRGRRPSLLGRWC